MGVQSRTKWARGSLGVVLLLAGCDVLDLTEVTNPNPTAEDFAQAAEPTKALLPGLKAQMARAVKGVVIVNTLVSDEMEIAFSNYTSDVSDPYMVRSDGAVYDVTGESGAYWHLQELRAFADFVIDSIGANDPTATPSQLATARYHRGMAYLMQGENFIGVPRGRGQEPTPWRDLLELAAEDFGEALSLGASGELQVALHAALARTHRGLGSAAAAGQHAEAALALDPAFVSVQPYYAGEIEPLREIRGMQPLPRLDFLSPKYVSFSSPIPVGKAEEMHLILAEVAMAGGDYIEGATRVAEAVRIAAGRPTTEFSDPDLRLNRDQTVRPRESGMLVRADPQSPFRAGLVQDHPGVITAHTISGTSLDGDSVAALTDPEDIRHALWLARNEILYLEGRRLHDFGVRMPVTRREIDASPAIDDGDPETLVQVPSYIPRGGVLDSFSPRSPYSNPSAGTGLFTNEITIDVDMNRILATERVSPLGTLP